MSLKWLKGTTDLILKLFNYSIGKCITEKSYINTKLLLIL